MPIILNHTVVPARDKEAAARFFAEIFGLPYEKTGGYFAPVRVNETLTLDFHDAVDRFEIHHYAFHVSDQEFDAILKEATGPQRFVATFRFTDGREATYELAGDEFYVDAHILKWHPYANIIGLHTAYEIDRVAGRYRAIKDEREAMRTVHALARDKPVDLYSLVRRYTFLAPLLDAEYGSATFVPVTRAAQLELRVSTTGLLMRETKR